MPKSIAQANEEEARLGRETPQMNAQEDTLKSLEQKDFGSNTTLTAILSQLDVFLSTRASETTLISLETELDRKPDEANTANEYNLTLTNQNTEYYQVLPAKTRALEFWARENVDIRFAFTTGRVATPTAPYFTLKAGLCYYKENLNLSSKTLYLACDTAGNHVEIIAWT